MDAIRRTDVSAGRGIATGGSRARSAARSGLRRLARAAAAAVTLAVAPAVSPAASPAAVPQGVWLIDARAAVQIFDCAGMMCGRIIWLLVPRDASGRLDRDFRNPDVALRARALCGQTILWNLIPDGQDRWREGWFYNPNDGKTYRVSARLKSDDVMIARVYDLLPLLGTTKTLTRVSRDTTAGWC